MNINDGVGSTHLDKLQAAVLEHGADVGIAHDGDADRCLAVDADGEIVDGDRIMAILAVSMHERGTLTDDTLVVTVMSNLGLQAGRWPSTASASIETKVGDRYVLEALAAEHLALGGEQSGHVIMTEYATTGDGVLTGPAPRGRDGPHGQDARRARVGHDRLPAGARQRARRRPPRPATPTT